MTNKCHRCQNFLKKAFEKLKSDIKNWRVFSYWYLNGLFSLFSSKLRRSLSLPTLVRTSIKICKTIRKPKSRKVWAVKNLEEIENGLLKQTTLAWYNHHHFLKGRSSIPSGLKRKKQLSLMENKLQPSSLPPIPQQWCPWVEGFVDCKHNMCCCINNK